jgi:hypothetical protein
LHVIEFLLDPVEPLIHVNNEFLNPIVHFLASDVVSGNFFAGAVEQNADPRQLIELAFKKKAHETHHSG